MKKIKKILSLLITFSLLFSIVSVSMGVQVLAMDNTNGGALPQTGSVIVKGPHHITSSGSISSSIYVRAGAQTTIRVRSAYCNVPTVYLNVNESVIRSETESSFSITGSYNGAAQLLKFTVIYDLVESDTVTLIKSGLKAYGYTYISSVASDESSVTSSGRNDHEVQLVDWRNVYYVNDPFSQLSNLRFSVRHHYKALGSYNGELKVSGGSISGAPAWLTVGCIGEDIPEADILGAIYGSPDGKGYLTAFNVGTGDVTTGLYTMQYSISSQSGSNVKTVGPITMYLLIYDDSALKLIYEQEQKYTRQEEHYTPESWAAYRSAMEAAALPLHMTRTVGTFFSQVVSQYDSATARLQAAVAGLQFVAADYSTIDAQQAYFDDLCNRLGHLYTPASLQYVQNEINKVPRGLNISYQRNIETHAEYIENIIRTSLVYRAADYNAINEKKDWWNTLPNKTLNYSADSIRDVDNAFKAVDYSKNIIQQAEVDLMYANILAKIAALVERQASYTTLNTLIGKIPPPDLYTWESYSKIVNFLETYDKNLPRSQQSIVNGYVTELQGYINALIEKSADYTLVYLALAKVPSDSELDKLYEPSGVSALRRAIADIKYDKKLSEQSVVNNYAYVVESYISNLQLLPANYEKVIQAIAMVNALDRSVFVDMSMLDYAVAQVVWGLKISQQAVVDSFADAINAARASLIYLPANYSEVDEMLSLINSIDTSQYAPESIEKLNAAKNAVVRAYNITRQKDVDIMARDLRDAYEGLFKKLADYTQVYTALDRVPGSLAPYTLESAQNLLDAINRVATGLEISEQVRVDLMAQDINDAINGLVIQLADYTLVNLAIQRVPKTTTNYVNYSVVKTALDLVVRGYDITHQDEVDKMAEAINIAVDSLVLKGASYRVVDIALSYVPNNLSIYTKKSIAVLTSAINAVDWGLDITQQTAVNNMATVIVNAQKALKKLANYSTVYDAKLRIPENLNLYTANSVAALNNVLDSIDYDLDESNQAMVNAYAVSINSAIDELVLKEADIVIPPGSNTIIDRVNGYIYGIDVGVSDLQNYVAAVGGELVITSSSGGAIGTGTLIQLYSEDGEQIDSFTLIIFGDIDGDGQIKGSDYAFLQQVVAGTVELTDAVKFAADVNGDGVINSMDTSILAQIISSTFELDQTKVW